MGQIYKWNSLILESWVWYTAWTGIDITWWEISNTWVTSVNWQTWDVTVSAWWWAYPILLPNTWIIWATDDYKYIPSVVAWTWIYIDSPLQKRITDNPWWWTNTPDLLWICVYKWYIYVFFHNTSSSTYRNYLYVIKSPISWLPTLTWATELNRTNIGVAINASNAKCLWMDDDYFYICPWWFSWVYKVQRWTWTATTLSLDTDQNVWWQYSTMRTKSGVNEFLLYWKNHIQDESWNVLYDTWNLGSSWWWWLYWFFTVWDTFYVYTWNTLTASSWSYRIWIPLQY